MLRQEPESPYLPSQFSCYFKTRNVTTLLPESSDLPYDHQMYAKSTNDSLELAAYIINKTLHSFISMVVFSLLHSPNKCQGLTVPSEGHRFLQNPADRYSISIYPIDRHSIRNCLNLSRCSV